MSQTKPLPSTSILANSNSIYPLIQTKVPAILDSCLPFLQCVANPIEFPFKVYPD